MEMSASRRTPEPESETPSQIQPAKPISFTNGVLKRHKPHTHNPHSPPIVITYKECLKNHAATLGGHALDGCGEFMPSPTSAPTDPTYLKCAACGCHRNFHRREPEVESSPASATPTIEYLPQHRHHPPPPTPTSHNSASPPPISSSYHTSAPHVLLVLSGGQTTGALDNNTHLPSNTSNLGSNPKKRFRTKFTQIQKDKMLEFAEKIGWRIQKRDEQLIQEFCRQVGVHREVLKVWMHNNKNTFVKKDEANNLHTGLNHEDKNNGQNLNLIHHFETVDCVAHTGTNASSSPS
ncbi:Zinc-finger homeodomain protein 10 [Hibiscus syriacus]|uniref:Zinc-finger homeodomain protein 10 n=1 Tax=Hibiscus syriacus TaxID=106335 RepID=A0A6A2ZWG8_HIBSY|nr:zinc-finger homeodomain protein 10-like [Hibiscus syriacus]KAE8696178.1 Zinc-finger homeodomain protein 10 [Hibiscus syriacus]